MLRARIVGTGSSLPDKILTNTDLEQMVDTNEYKRRQAPIGIKITPVSFGKDRRMPITNFYGK